MNQRRIVVANIIDLHQLVELVELRGGLLPCLILHFLVSFGLLHGILGQDGLLVWPGLLHAGPDTCHDRFLLLLPLSTVLTEDLLRVVFVLVAEGVDGDLRSAEHPQVRVQVLLLAVVVAHLRDLFEGVAVPVGILHGLSHVLIETAMSVFLPKVTHAIAEALGKEAFSLHIEPEG